MAHFASAFAERSNEILHVNLPSTLCYRHEILEVPGLVTGLFITYDGQHSDEFIVRTPVSWSEFLQRLCQTKAAWHDLQEATMRSAVEKPEKAFIGWEGRNIYIFRGGSVPEQWNPALADQWLAGVLSGSALLWGPIVKNEWDNLDEIVPLGKDGASAFEHHVRVAMNYLFGGSLTNGGYQCRTEDDGVEIRDLIYRNAADSGFWRDLKDKYSCSEIIVEAKNKIEISRDDLRQVYCYLKPATGLFGLLISRGEVPAKIAAYNRQVFRNFAQQRFVLVMTRSDLQKMVAMKLRKLDPAEHLAYRMAEFIRSV